MPNIYHIYLKDISSYKLLSKEEEVTLVYSAQNGNQKAFDKLIVSNQKFVISVAKKFLNQGLDLMDLISLGNIGLIESIKRFDPTTGNKLITYSVWWIRQKIMEGIGNESRLIRLPLNRTAEIADVVEEFKQQTLGSSYLHTLRKICDSKNVSEAEIINRISIYHMISPKHRDSILVNPENLVSDDFMEDRLNLDTKRILKNKIGLLKDRQAYIANSYFDLFGNSRTLESIGEELNLTRERVRQIKVKILKKLSVSIDKNDFNNTMNIPYSIVHIKEKSYTKNNELLYEISDFINDSYQTVDTSAIKEQNDIEHSFEDEILEELYDQL